MNAEVMKSDGGDQASGNPNLAKRLATIYRRVVLTTVLIFAALISVLLVSQYFNKRSQVMKFAADDLQDRAISVDYFLANAAEDIVETKIWAENYLDAADSKSQSHFAEISQASSRTMPALVLIDIPPIAEPYGTIIRPASVDPKNADLIRQANMASRLLEIQRINHYAPPNFTWSEFRSLSGLVSVYPKVDAAVGALIWGRPVAQAMLSVFNRETPRVNDWEFSRSVEWSQPYLDMPGRGLMITCASPVYDRGRLIGMVSAEIKLNFLSRFVESAVTRNERILIANRQGQVLAATGMQPDKLDAVPTLGQLLPEVAEIISSPSPREPNRIRRGGNLILSARLDNVNWTVIKVVPERDVARALFPEALFGALLVGLMFGFLVTANRVVNRYFVHPAVSFVEFIETEAVEGAAPRPEAPPAWRQWFLRISDILALKSVAANLPGAIFQVKRERTGGLTITMASSGVKELLGISPEKLIGQTPLSLDYLPTEEGANFERKFQESVSDLRPFAHETLTRTPDQSPRWVRFIVRPRLGESGEIMWDGLMLDISDRKAMEDELRRRRDHLEETVSIRTGELERLNAELLKEIAERSRSESALKASEESLRVMSQQMIHSQESERARLSRELHDEIGQQLTAILFQLTVSRNQTVIAPEEIVRIETMVRDIGENLHRICRGLQPITLTQFGLGPAIKMMLWEYMEIYGRKIEMKIEPPDYSLTDEGAVAAYRICQEAVTNGIRHSEAEGIQVALCRADNYLILEVRDRGKGFDLDRARAGGKLGLKGMSQRAEHCGGELTIETAPGSGARVVFKVMVKKIERGPL